MGYRLKTLSAVVLAAVLVFAPYVHAQNMPWLDIRDFGAVAGGECTAAIQMAVNTAVSKGGGVVLIPPGTYKVGGNGIAVNAPLVTIRGMGEEISILQYSGTNTAITIAENTPNIRVESLSIKGSAAGKAGILVGTGSASYHIERVWVYNFLNGTGILAAGSNNCGQISAVELSGNNVGIRLSSGTASTSIAYSKIYNNYLYGMELVEASNVSIVSTQAEKNGNTTDGASIKATGVQGLNITGCYNEQNASFPGVFLWLANGVKPCTSVNVTGCRSIGNLTSPACLRTEGGEAVTFLGNFIGSFDQTFAAGSSPIHAAWLSNRPN